MRAAGRLDPGRARPSPDPKGRPTPFWAPQWVASPPRNAPHARLVGGPCSLGAPTAAFTVGFSPGIPRGPATRGWGLPSQWGWGFLGVSTCPQRRAPFRKFYGQNRDFEAKRRQTRQVSRLTTGIWPLRGRCPFPTPVPNESGPPPSGAGRHPQGLGTAGQHFGAREGPCRMAVLALCMQRPNGWAQREARDGGCRLGTTPQYPGEVPQYPGDVPQYPGGHQQRDRDSPQGARSSPQDTRVGPRGSRGGP